MAEESAVQEGIKAAVESETVREGEAAVEKRPVTLLEPDLEFIREVKKAGGDTLKKCFQCATCSVVCALSPDEKPYPRKEMIYSQWGLRDRLLNDVDIWLCHYCNDCSTYCPRGARPGDVLRAIRALSFRYFAFPSFMGKVVGEAKYLPVMLGIPVLLFLFLLSLTGHLHIPEGEIEFARFFPHYLVDSIFIVMSTLAMVSFGFGLNNFIQGIHSNAIREGYAEDKPLVINDYLKSLVSVIPTILLHSKFKLCTTNRDRYWAHLLTLYGFVGLFIVTSIGFLGLYIVRSDFLAPPYPFFNPIKLFALASGVSLLSGIILVIANRRKPKTAESTTTYLDWSLIIAILVVAITGFLSWLSRLSGLAGIAYPMYFIHLVCVFYIIAYLPYSKLAHLVYRTAAMGYAAYIDRPFGIEVNSSVAVPAPEGIPSGETLAKAEAEAVGDEVDAQTAPAQEESQKE
ncbi:MAG: quinone-interacting membrane-bound oxidoreductase complex subunit QmoC [Deltaproteobacteria bacterium]|nr:quinone-interacting membrane-bound oxidoreductase complex subunit QmoC [Deltaproteobacteria bacterium]MBW2070113.1 quinone-interacting membrane-bound oxidoreductase complex subunit QmoC [Deltaproteobacteria bacterium]